MQSIYVGAGGQIKLREIFGHAKRATSSIHDRRGVLRESSLVSSSCFDRCVFGGGQSVNISLLFILINVH